MQVFNSSSSKRAYKQDSSIIKLSILISIISLFFFTGYSRAVTLTVTSINGSVTVTPDKAQYNTGEVVQLIPKPATGYSFSYWGGDAYSKSLVLNLKMDTNKSITANFETWQPPVGIPTPPFGINETYRMYDDPNNRNPNLTYYPSPMGGYYTHYVDNTDANSTDTSNTYGTVSKPRKNPLGVGTVYPPGSIIEVHGGPYNNTYQFIRSDGNEAMPVFFHSDPEAKATINSSTYIFGHYMIFENFTLPKNCSMPIDSQLLYGLSDHLCIRNCYSPESLYGGMSVTSNRSYSADEYTRYMVFYNNVIDSRGDFEAEENGEDDDTTGIIVGLSAQYVWIIDNHIHYTTGSGIVVNAGGSATRAAMENTHHIYIGHNIVWDTYQSCIGLKRATDVVISQNLCYDPKRRTGESGSPAKGFSFQYGPDRVWVLFNEFYGGQYGIFSATASSMTGGSIYIIGNLIHDTVHLSTLGAESMWGDDNGIFFTDDENAIKYVINNTIYRCGGGIYSDRGSGAIHIYNNILGDINDTHVWLGNSTVATHSTASNDLFDETAVIKWGSSTVRDVNEMQSVYDKFNDCLETDPLFTDADANDYTLQAESPAIDAGLTDPCGVYALFESLYEIDIKKDYAGITRPQNEIMDIGAYEQLFSAISDVTVTGSSQNSASIKWTVPGEDEGGDCQWRYDIRYSTNPITEGNWNTDGVIQVQGEPVPIDGGQEQSFIISGLNSGTTYYIAIKTTNISGSTASQLSNVVSATTRTDGNHAPVLEPIGNKTVVQKGTLTFVVSATDADAGDTLTFSAANLPPGASFSASLRTFTWTPGINQGGTYYVTGNTCFVQFSYC